MKNLSYLVLLAAFTTAAHATDGVIEINDAKIKANGGYPYTISQSGSYRLTSNLTQSDINVNVLVISADNVTLDLNGFTIAGPNTCSGSPLICNLVGAGMGVSGSSASYTTIKNGSVRGMGGTAIFLGGSANTVEDVRVSDSNGFGVDLGGNNSSTVRRAKVSRCSSAGISAVLVVESTAEGNGYTGILADQVFNSYAYYNGMSGISADLVSHSKAYSNSGHGIDTANAVSNWVGSNHLDGIHLWSDGVAIGNVTISNDGTGINTGGHDVTFTQNNISTNAGGSVGGSPPPHSLPANSNLCNGSPC